MTILKHTTRLTDVPSQVPDGWPSLTHDGMAHFAGTGPLAFCSSCNHGVQKGKTVRCNMFRRLTGRTGKAFPAKTLACRHYEGQS